MVEAVPVGAAPAAPPAAEPAAQPDPDLADRRPKLRPEGLAPATGADDALLQAEPGVQVTSLRPRERPQIILAAGERARSETASASLASAAPAGAEEGNSSVLSISRRPASKPDDFSGAVEAAVAAAVRLPVPEAEPEAKSADPGPAPELKPEEQDEANEPEVASAAPKIPTKASVAKQATFRNALNLSKTNLIGVYGTQSKRYALVRLSTGKYKKVRVGDRIDGGTVKAITQSEVRYQKGGRLVSLKMPKG
jgi:type IV pilus biogenesis protein PilP